MNEIAASAELVDAYITKRSERLLADKVAEKLKKEETDLQKKLIEICIAAKAKALGGSKGVVNYARENKPTVISWEKLYEYIKEHDAFELLQRRLGEGAVVERWEDGIVIPGVATFPVDKLTISGKS
jgi:O-methyltransferase involved in polyketide biosynthesis